MVERSVRGQAERGSILIVAVVAIVLLVGISGSFLSQASFQGKQTGDNGEDIRVLYIAEAGINRAIAELNSQRDLDQDGRIGSVSGSMGGGTYAATASPMGGPGASWVLQSMATLGTACRAIQSYVEPRQMSLFTMAAFGDQGVTMDSNSFTDSYDSALGSYESQITGGFRGHDVAHPNGTVGSNQNIHLSSNAAVMGSTTPGPGGTVTLDQNAFVLGSTAPAPSLRALPPIAVPDIPPSGDFELQSNSSATIPSGSYHFGRFTTDSNTTLRIEGPATIVVDYLNVNSNSTVTIVPTGGPVKIYGTGTFHIDSNASVSSSTTNPADVSILITTDNIADSTLLVKVDSNAALYGTIYAPNADIKLASNAELYGAIVAAQIRMDSNFRVHYDEALGRQGEGTPVYRLRGWQELPRPC